MDREKPGKMRDAFLFIDPGALPSPEGAFT
jgi:hypothetical protein